MAVDRSFYFDRLYPLQDEVLRLLRQIETGFYLSGGTAASRGYLQHRFSDDLDLFVNDDRRFGLWADRVVTALASRADWTVEVVLREERFVRITLDTPGVPLKLEFIDDVPSHVGAVTEHPILARLDSAENILANKLTALVDLGSPRTSPMSGGSAARSGCRSRTRLPARRARRPDSSHPTWRDVSSRPPPTTGAWCGGSTRRTPSASSPTCAPWASVWSSSVTADRPGRRWGTCEPNEALRYTARGSAGTCVARARTRMSRRQGRLRS